MAGQGGEPVEVAPYNPDWPGAYERESARILSHTADLFVALEHIGSTAVPGLAAKPVIDMMGGLRSLDDAPRCVDTIVGLGYEYVPKFEDEFPQRRYFRLWGEVGRRTHQLHAVVHGEDWWNRHIRFRDTLRADPEASRMYALLKHELAERFRNDRVAYTNAKDEFIAGVLSRVS